MTHTSQRFCLRWNNHQSNLLSVFDQLLHDESFVDVTLAVEGQLLKAHKMVLSACSPYFQTLFVNHQDKHPIVILKDVPFADMRSLLDFMYRGEVSVDQDRLTAFLKVAESLRIKGLTEVNEEKCDLPSIASSLLSNNQRQTTPPPAAPPPPPNLHRIHLTQPSSSSSSPSSAKRSAPSPNNFSSFAGNNVSSLFGQKRKRGRPRKLSGSSDTPSAASPEHELNADSDNRNSTIQSNLSESSYAHGPPDLLEVNMTEQSQNSPGSFQEDQNIESPEQGMVDGVEDIIKSEPTDDPSAPGTSFQDPKSPLLKDNSSSRSQSQTPTSLSERYAPDLPQLRLVPKSELLANYGGSSSKNDSENNNNNCSSSNLNNNSNNGNFLLNSTSPHFMLNNEMKFSPPPHLMSPQSNASGSSTPVSLASGECFTGTPPTKPTPARRRVRRRATSSSDPAEQLTEMSVRGLNLFRYACIDEGVYKCLECAKSDIVKTFKNKYSFQRHAFLYHEGCQRKVFPCPVCGKEFSRPDKMKNHMKTVHDCFMPKECLVPKDILFPPPPPIPFFLSPP